MTLLDAKQKTILWASGKKVIFPDRRSKEERQRDKRVKYHAEAWNKLLMRKYRPVRKWGFLGKG